MSMGEPPESYEARKTLSVIPGVMSIGWDGLSITVTVKDESVRALIPPQIGKVPVRVIVSGPLRSF